MGRRNRNRPCTRRSWILPIFTVFMIAVMFGFFMFLIIWFAPFYVGDPCDGVENVSVGKQSKCSFPQYSPDGYFRPDSKFISAYQYYDDVILDEEYAKDSFEFEERVLGESFSSLAFELKNTTSQIHYECKLSATANVYIVDEKHYKLYLGETSEAPEALVSHESKTSVDNTFTNFSSDRPLFLLVINRDLKSIKVTYKGWIGYTRMKMDASKAIKVCSGKRCFFERPSQTVVYLSYNGTAPSVPVTIIRGYDASGKLIMPLLLFSIIIVICFIGIIVFLHSCIVNTLPSSYYKKEEEKRNQVSMTSVAVDKPAQTTGSEKPVQPANSEKPVQPANSEKPVQHESSSEDSASSSSEDSTSSSSEDSTSSSSEDSLTSSSSSKPVTSEPVQPANVDACVPVDPKDDVCQKDEVCEKNPDVVSSSKPHVDETPSTNKVPLNVYGVPIDKDEVCEKESSCSESETNLSDLSDDVTEEEDDGSSTNEVPLDVYGIPIVP